MIGLTLALAAATSSIVIGPGNATCEVAMAPAFRERSFDYIWGVWTGMNIASNRPVGHTTDDHSILKEVLAGCAAFPTLTLADAILGVHMRFEKEGR